MHAAPVPFAQTGTPHALAVHPTPEPAPQSGWRAFDDLALVRPGRLLLADVGAAAGERLLMGLLAGAVALGRDAIVVDGGNWLDVYRLGEAARAHGLPRETVLGSVRVARGFTAHQLQSLVEDALPRALAEDGANVGLVLVPGFPEMYLDEDLARAEARVLLARALATLRALARDRRVPCVVTNGVLSPRARDPLRAALEEGADEIVGLFPAPRGALRLALPKEGRAILAPAPGARQRALDDFATLAAAREGEVGEFVRRAPDARLKFQPKHAGELKAKQRAEKAATMERIFA